MEKESAGVEKAKDGKEDGAATVQPKKADGTAMRAEVQEKKADMGLPADTEGVAAVLAGVVEKALGPFEARLAVIERQAPGRGTVLGGEDEAGGGDGAPTEKGGKGYRGLPIRI